MGLMTKPATESLLQTVPNRPGRVATGGFQENLYLYSKFATGAERVPRQDIERLLNRHADRVTGLAKLKELITDVAEDQFVFAALHEFLEGGGKFIGMATGGHYRAVPVPEDERSSLIIAIGLADTDKYEGGPVSPAMFLPDWDIRKTIVHELLHYVFDKLDTAVSEPDDLSGADHVVIEIMEARYLITDLARRGELLKNGLTFDYKAWRASNPGANVLDTQFVSELLKNKLQALQQRNKTSADFNARGIFRLIYNEDQLRELAYLYSINAVFVQEAAWLAETLKPKKPQDAFADKNVRAVYQAFVERFTDHLSRSSGAAALGEAHTLMREVVAQLAHSKK